MASCSFCGHSEADHCKGGQLHTDHKEDARMTPTKYRTGTHTCVSRHCEEPLCCCVAFMGPSAHETSAELEEFAELIARDDRRETLTRAR